MEQRIIAKLKLNLPLATAGVRVFYTVYGREDMRIWHSQINSGAGYD